MKAMLMDTTLCVGCRGCQIACKEWNNLPAEKTEFFGGDGYQNPKHLSAKTWTLITFSDARDAKGYDWVFAKRQCLHCLEPACVSVCLMGALQKTKNGPVTYDKDICLGCRYCQLACPFGVPGFEWEKAIPLIAKCTMCADRMNEDMEPACAKACPTDAIAFGDRQYLIRLARRRMIHKPTEYVDHIYGEHEVGGTCVMHISNVPFEQLNGFPKGLPKTPLGWRSQPVSEAVPFLMTGLGLTLGGVSWIVHRRMENQEKQQSEGDKP